MIYPREIKKGDIFGITATSMGVNSKEKQERLQGARNTLKELGYDTIVTNNVLKNKKLVSSSAKVRANEFLELWNTDVSVIFPVRGGEFLMEILPFLDSGILSTNPKWVVGYSDTSLLNFYLTTKYKIATVTATNVLHFTKKEFNLAMEQELKLLENSSFIQQNFSYYENIDGEYSSQDKVIYKHLYQKDRELIQGYLIGGCLESIKTILGTRFDNTKEFVQTFDEGMLWYFDIYDSNPIDLYRSLWQMKEAGWFLNINGVLVGRTKAIKEVFDFTFLDALHKVFDDMHIPVIYDADIGHVLPQWSIINGSFGIISYKNGKCSLETLKK